MIHHAEIVRPDGSVANTVPMAQYQINEVQYLSVVAGGGTDSMAEATSDQPVTWEFWGRLDAISFIMQSQLRHSMHRDGWDFNQYPNPHVFLGTINNQGGAEA